MNPEAPVTPPPAAPQPVVPAPPIQQPPVAPPASPALPPAASANSTASQSKKGLILGIIGAAFGFLLLIALSYIFLFSPAAQAKKASNTFMKAITANDVTKALAVTDGAETTKSFLQTAAGASAGSYKLQKQTHQGSNYYYLYSLSNDKNKHARTTVTKQDGKWEVVSYVYASSELALIPDASSDTATTKTETTTTPATTAALACLVQDDYKWMNFDKQPGTVTFDTTYDPAKHTSNKTADMYFKPDTATEDSLPSIYDDWADFAKHNADKQWKFRLEGSTFGSDAAAASSKALADQRAQKVKSQLVSRGVPADRIVIDPPHDYGKEAQDDSKNQIYRRVQVIIDPTCTSSSR